MPKLIGNFPTPEFLRPEKTALLRTARKVLELCVAELCLEPTSSAPDRNFTSGTGLTQPLTELFKIKARNDIARAESKVES
jgi:hypothetical protein